MKPEKQDWLQCSSRGSGFTAFADVVTAEAPGVDERPSLIDPPVTTVADFRTLNEGEVLQGYLDGVHGGPWPEPERSRSYRHGWQNGMVDRGCLPLDEAMRALERDFDRLR